MPHRTTMERVWDAHIDGEFAQLDLEATMRTMTDHPTVIHLPTAMGGVGRESVADFYQRWFIGRNPADFTLTPLSRTVGNERIVDELIVSFTHDVEMPWILPGMEPTGKPVRVPLVVIVGFRDGAVDSEHIYWDQGSVLAQIQLDPDEVARLPIISDQVALLDGHPPLNHLVQR